eukprot:354565-Chlamydomonas_euryale.AAC.10
MGGEHRGARGGEKAGAGCCDSKCRKRDWTQGHGNSEGGGAYALPLFPLTTLSLLQTVHVLHCVHILCPSSGSTSRSPSHPAPCTAHTPSKTNSPPQPTALHSSQPYVANSPDSIPDRPVADLTGNQLSAPLPRSFLEGACIGRAAWLGFAADRSGSGGGGVEAAIAQSRPGGSGGTALWLFYGSDELAQWAAPYAYAIGQASYSGQERSVNMCGSYE